MTFLQRNKTLSFSVFPIYLCANICFIVFSFLCAFIPGREFLPFSRSFAYFIWLHWILVVACGIQFPNQGSNPGPLHWELGVLATGPRRKSQILFLILVTVMFGRYCYAHFMDEKMRLRGPSKFSEAPATYVHLFDSKICASLPNQGPLFGWHFLFTLWTNE